jgi:hypothetical protein
MKSRMAARSSAAWGVQRIWVIRENLIRPLDPPPDRQGFYSCDRIKRLLVRR